MQGTARMSAIDAAWLRMDRPTNPMVIVSVTILAGRCTPASLRSLLAARLLRFDRFRCRPVADSLGGTWAPDRHFDLRQHVGEVKLPRGATSADLQRAVGELAGTPLDGARPRWRFDLVQTPGRGSALVMRMHHCYADGIALVKVFLGMTSTAPDAPPADQPIDPELLRAGLGARDGRAAARDAATSGNVAASWAEVAAENLFAGAAALAADANRMSSSLIDAVVKTATHPVEAWAAAKRGVADAGNVAAAVASLLALPDDPPTPLRGRLGRTRRVAWTAPLPLAEVRAVARALGCTINDVVVSVVAGSLGRYLGTRGCDVTGLTVRAALPVNLRPPDEPLRLGNRFGLVLVDLPVGLSDPLARLFTVRTAMRSLKGSPQAVATYAVLNALGTAPSAVETFAVDVLSRKASAVVSNVPGPRTPLYFCGRRIDQMYFWVPQSGSIGVGVSILSYVDEVLFGLVADTGLVPDPDAALADVALEFERLVLLTLLGAAQSEPLAKAGAGRRVREFEAESSAVAAGRRTRRAPSPPRRRNAPSRR
jgi:diacylglycerol O-acyltransferase